MDEKELTEQIGRRFREFRLGQGLRQKDISAVLGTTHSNISRLERGTVRRPSALFLNNCRAKFGLSIDWLVTGQGPMLAAEDIVSLPQELPPKKGRKKRPGRPSSSTEQKAFQRKLDELATALARVTRLVHELFAHARDQDALAHS